MSESTSSVEAAWDAELERRLIDIKQGTAVGEPVELVVAEFEAKYPCERPKRAERKQSEQYRTNEA